MPGGLLRRTEGGKDDQTRQALIGEIDLLSKKVEEIKEKLPQPGKANARAMDKYAGFVNQDIGEKFIEYLHGRYSRYYQFLNSGDAPRSFVTEIINLCRTTAELFERYVHEPNSYRRSACQQSLQRLLVELRNLRLLCQKY